jgi:hypothetical protein
MGKINELDNLILHRGKMFSVGLIETLIFQRVELRKQREFLEEEYSKKHGRVRQLEKITIPHLHALFKKVYER